MDTHPPRIAGEHADVGHRNFERPARGPLIRLVVGVTSVCLVTVVACSGGPGTGKGVTTPAVRKAAGTTTPRSSGSASVTTSASPSGSPAAAVVAIRPPLRPVAAPALPGEGVFTSLATVAGQPVVQAALLRPDASETAMAAVVWIDSAATWFVLHPGSQEPGGGPWSQPDALPPALRTGLLATFNGGFKMTDSHGGYYADGHTVNTLVPGAASEVFYANGHMTVGVWGRDATLTPDVIGVRQNLQLLIDGGRLSPIIDGAVQQTWGLTLGGGTYVWRSGVGVTATGDVVFALGPSLSPRTLADLLLQAGAVRAMQLDINPAWPSFMSYQPSPSGPVPQKLLPFYRPADRYFQVSTRDFVAVYAH